MKFTSNLMKALSDPDKLKQLADKAQKAVSDNQEQIQGAIDKAGAAVSKKTGGRYDEKITKMSDAATDAIDKVTKQTDEQQAETDEQQTGAGEPPAGAGKQQAEPGEPPAGTGKQQAEPGESPPTGAGEKPATDG